MQTTTDQDRSAASISLHELVAVGRAAVVAEVLVILVMSGCVLALHAVAPSGTNPWLSLYVPLIALVAGLLGALFAGPGAVGLIRNPVYVLVYYSTIAVMIAVDLGVRLLLGGELVMVFANWAVLIGSASAVNLFLTRVPFLSARRWLDESNLSGMHPVAIGIAIVIQVLQAGVSLLGAGWGVVAVQLLARRVAFLPIAHVLARRSYGRDCAGFLLANESLEYVAIASVCDPEGRVHEPDPLDQSVVGMMLLKLPMFAGEPMSAGRKSLTRVGDKLLFLEQMLAFSSPTMVVSRSCALGHIAFLHTMLSFDGEPARSNPRLIDRVRCKAKVRAALAGRWSEFRGVE